MVSISLSWGSYHSRENKQRGKKYSIYRSFFKRMSIRNSVVWTCTKIHLLHLTAMGQSESVFLFWNVKGQIFHFISSWLLYIKKMISFWRKMILFLTDFVFDRLPCYGAWPSWWMTLIILDPDAVKIMQKYKNSFFSVKKRKCQEVLS